MKDKLLEGILGILVEVRRRIAGIRINRNRTGIMRF